MLVEGILSDPHGANFTASNIVNDPHDGNTLRAPTTPAWLSPHDDRRLRDVFEQPMITFADPSQMHWRANNNGGVQMPNVPHAPVTTGLRQVCYNGEAMWDRSCVDQVGPVRAFFRLMMARKGKIVQA
jgi:hypothetical protein